MSLFAVAVLTRKHSYKNMSVFLPVDRIGVNVRQMANNIVSLSFCHHFWKHLLFYGGFLSKIPFEVLHKLER